MEFSLYLVFITFINLICQFVHIDTANKNIRTTLRVIDLCGMDATNQAASCNGAAPHRRR